MFTDTTRNGGGPYLWTIGVGTMTPPRDLLLPEEQDLRLPEEEHPFSSFQKKKILLVQKSWKTWSGGVWLDWPAVDSYRHMPLSPIFQKTISFFFWKKNRFSYGGRGGGCDFGHRLCVRYWYQQILKYWIWMSFRFHFGITSSSRRFHFALTSISPRLHFEATSISLWFHLDCSSSSLRVHFDVTPILFLRVHFEFTLMSIRCRFDFIQFHLISNQCRFDVASVSLRCHFWVLRVEDFLLLEEEDLHSSRFQKNHKQKLLPPETNEARYVDKKTK